MVWVFAAGVPRAVWRTVVQRRMGGCVPHPRPVTCKKFDNYPHGDFHLRMRCLLVIPALNEEPTIARVIEAAKGHIPDILVVDDGSEDGTAAAATHANVVVTRHDVNKGKGEA